MNRDAQDLYRGGCEELERRTEGLDGCDISNAVIEALMQPARKASSLKCWQKIFIHPLLL